MKARYYQEEAVGSLMNYLDESDGHPLIVIPTGAGKTKIIVDLIDVYLSEYPETNVLVLSHIQEILEQNANALKEEYGGFVGVYSAGLNSREVKKITVAGIQSVYNKAGLFADVSIVIIDECHLIPIKGTGMYRQLLSKLNATYIGLTATPFRLGHGYINEGSDAIFDDVVYDLSSYKNYNKLVEEGYLSRIISKSTDLEMDISGVRTIGGDFKQDDLADKFDVDNVTSGAIKEIIKYGRNYKKWLIFAIDIAHAEHIASELTKNGISTVCVHSKMNGNRKAVISDIKAGKYRAIVNVNVLTTGFDVPDIDLIAMLRPTKSPVLHVQSVGRGGRVADSKDHCLFLDFAGNTARLGPINDIVIKKKGKGTGKQIIKTCPECGVMHHPSVKKCDVCGYEFKFKHGLNSKASTANIVKEYKDPQWVDVDNISYSIHSKRGSPSSLRVMYVCGLSKFSEWICIDHKGYPRMLAHTWIKNRLPTMPTNVHDLYKMRMEIAPAKQIKIDFNGKYPEIIGYRLDR